MSEVEELRAALERQARENERLKERLGPRGLIVVMIGGAGHYVSEVVAARIRELEAERDTLIRDRDAARDLAMTLTGRCEDYERDALEAIAERDNLTLRAETAERAAGALEKRAFAAEKFRAERDQAREVTELIEAATIKECALVLDCIQWDEHDGSGLDALKHAAGEIRALAGKDKSE